MKNVLPCFCVASDTFPLKISVMSFVQSDRTFTAGSICYYNAHIDSVYAWVITTCEHVLIILRNITVYDSNVFSGKLISIISITFTNKASDQICLIVDISVLLNTSSSHIEQFPVLSSNWLAV